MATRGGAVHVATTKRVYKGKTYVTHLLRRSFRKGKTVTHETLGNLSHLPDHLIGIIKRSLKGETFVPAAEAIRITRTLPHGHVEAVLTMIHELGLDDLIAYGVLTDADGRPVAVQVYPGNTGDPKTVPDQVEALTKRFGLSRVVLVGDRGMLTQTQIDVLKKHPGLGWISALRSGSIRRLLADGLLVKHDLEAQRLAEITSPEFPGERLVACYNPQLAEQRRQKRQDLLAATQAELETLAASVAKSAERPETAAEIGVRAGKIINHYKVAKHFTLTLRDGHLGWDRWGDAITKE